MSNKSFTQFHAGSNVVIVGSNAELADVDNPRGDIHGFTAYVVAFNEYGDTRLSPTIGTYRSDRDAVEAAEKQAAALQSRYDNLGKLPVGFDRWAEGRAIYGSDAYVEYGADDDLAWERSQEEAF